MDTPKSWAEAIDVVTTLRYVWTGIHGRCRKPGQRMYERYGAKGITVCKEWSGPGGFKRFAAWALDNEWAPGLVIDRRDGSQGYSPENCRCVTQKVNSWNKSNNRMLTYQNETKCAAEWGEDPRCQVPKGQFQQRINAGWDITRALTTPLRRWTDG